MRRQLMIPSFLFLVGAITIITTIARICPAAAADAPQAPSAPRVMPEDRARADDELAAQNFADTVSDLNLPGVAQARSFNFQLYYNAQTKRWEIMTSDRKIVRPCRRTAAALLQAIADLRPDLGQQSRVTISCTSAAFALASCQVSRPYQTADAD